MLNLYRILSGEYVCRINGVEYTVKSPTPSVMYKAEVKYKEVMDKCKYDLIHLSDLKPILIRRGLITSTTDNDLKELEKNINNYKVEIYKLLFKEKEREKNRLYLRKAEDFRTKKLREMHSMDYLTIEGHASYVKSRYILAESIYGPNGKLWNCYEDADPALLDVFYGKYYTESLSESDIRAVSKSDTWISYWKSRGRDLFGSNITDEQRMLISYTEMYEAAHKADPPPHEHAFQDDDMFDGWLIIKSKEFESAKKKGSLNDLIKVKNQNAGELFIPASSREEADAIEELNDLPALIKKRSREGWLKQHGGAEDHHFPDVRQEAAQFAQKQFADKMKRK